MSKKFEAFSITVRFAQIAWLARLNHARETEGGKVDYGKVDDLVKTFTEDGWRKTGDGTIEIEKIDDSPVATADIFNEIMGEREAAWKAAKDAYEADTKGQANALKAFEDVFVGKNGKLIPVEYLGISGNRRSTAFFKSVVARVESGTPIDDTVPCIVKHFENAFDRLKCQIGENEDKRTGFMPMTDANRLYSAKRAVEMGATQNDLRKLYPSHGQKLFWVLQLDSRFPSINLYQRCLAKPDNPDFIKFSAIKGAELPELGLRTEPERLAKRNAELKVKGKSQISPANETDVRDYFASVTSSTSNKPKILERDAIESLSQHFPDNRARTMAAAILNNNTAELEKVRDQSTGFNALGVLYEQGDGPQMEQINLGLIRLEKGKARDAVLTAILKLFPKVVEGKKDSVEAPKESVESK